MAKSSIGLYVQYLYCTVQYMADICCSPPNESLPNLETTLDGIVGKMAKMHFEKNDERTVRVYMVHVASDLLRITSGTDENLKLRGESLLV